MENTSRLRTFRTVQGGAELLIVVASFAAAAYAEAALMGTSLDSGRIAQAGWGMATAVLAFWFLAQCKREQDFQNIGIIFVLAGMNLIAQGLFAYLGLGQPASLLFLLGGGLLAGLAVMLERKWVLARLAPPNRGVLVVGYDASAAALIPMLEPHVLGVVGADTDRLPAEIPDLGSLEQLPDVIRTRRPGRIVLGLKDWSTKLSPSLLMRYRLAGVAVQESTALYEQMLSRVCGDRRAPFDLLFSRSGSTSRRALVGQAIYSNLLGLILLVCLSPVILLTALLAALFSGRGPVLERTECFGYQGIPFQLVRFRTRKMDGTDRLTTIGKIISRLHLAGLPQLFNVLRGEMAPFGPRPVRYEFAQRMNQLLPYYLHRFSVKAGILGWEQLHLGNDPGVPDEFVRLEYDLYYIENLSLLLDAEILIRSLVSFFLWPKRRPEESDRAGSR